MRVPSLSLLVADGRSLRPSPTTRCSAYRAGITAPSRSRPLSVPDLFRDPLVAELVAARIVCVLATFDRGLIHAVPMWFDRAGDHLLLATGSHSRKVVNLEQNPRATIVLHDSRPGFEVCGASIAGAVEVVRGPAAAALVERVHRRYVSAGAERSRAAREFLRSDDVALRFLPTSGLVWDERDSRASEELRALGAARPLLPTDPRP